MMRQRNKNVEHTDSKESSVSQRVNRPLPEIKATKNGLGVRSLNGPRDHSSRDRRRSRSEPSTSDEGPERGPAVAHRKLCSGQGGRATDFVNRFKLDAWLERDFHSNDRQILNSRSPFEGHHSVDRTNEKLANCTAIVRQRGKRMRG